MPIAKGRTGPMDTQAADYDPADFHTPDFGGYELFADAPADSPMRELVRRIDADPVYRHSDAMFAYHRAGGPWETSTVRLDFAYYLSDADNTRFAASPLNVVDSTEDTLESVTIRHEDIEGWDAQLYRSDPLVACFPADARVQGWFSTTPPTSPVLDHNGGLKDAHCYVVDRATELCYETYLTYRHATDGWIAGSGWYYNIRTGDWCPGVDPSDGRYVAPGTHRFPTVMINAAGLPMLPLLLRYDEVYTAGEVKHPIGVTLLNSFLAGTWTWPARGMAYMNRANWGGDFGTTFPYGARLRLTADWFHANVESDAEVPATGPDTPPGGWGPGALVVLRAMRRYGLMVADGGAHFELWAVQDSRWPWAGDLYEVQARVRCGYFEVVDFEDDLLEMTVTPATAAPGVERTLTFTYHGWERHAAEHPGNDVPNPLGTGPEMGYDDYPWRWSLRPYDQVTSLEVGGLAPGMASHHGYGIITPDEPSTSFVVTPADENLRIYPLTYPFGIPWPYGDGVMAIPTTTPTALSVAPTSATVPPGGTQQFTATVTGAADHQDAVRWLSDIPWNDGSDTPAWAPAIDTNTGLFSDYDKAESGTITAYLVADPTITATATVTIGGDPTPTVGGGLSRRHRLLYYSRRAL